MAATDKNRLCKDCKHCEDGLCYVDYNNLIGDRKLRELPSGGECNACGVFQPAKVKHTARHSETVYEHSLDDRDDYSAPGLYDVHGMSLGNGNYRR